MKKKDKQEILKVAQYTLHPAEKTLNQLNEQNERIEHEISALLMDTDISDVQISDKDKSDLIEKYDLNDYFQSNYSMTWNELSCKAKETIKSDVEIDDLLSDDQIANAHVSIKHLHNQFQNIHRLDAIDYSISIIGGLLGALIDILLIELPTDPSQRLNEGSLAKWLREKIEDSIPPGTGADDARVPFDMPYNTEDLSTRVEGLSSHFHRLYSLGHDPIIGLIAGTLDILKGTVTTIDKDGKFVVQKTLFNSKETEKNIITAFLKEIRHLKSDITTSAGLPAPFMCLFNLLDAEVMGQPISEIIKGMYWEGYDAIHFVSMTIPVFVEEFFVRICYSIKRIKEGYTVKNSISITANRSKRPKLGTMLFITHSIATMINYGKVKLTKNVLNINYPQWIVFAYRLYTQMLWVFVYKLNLQHEYVLSYYEKERNRIISEMPVLEM